MSYPVALQPLESRRESLPRDSLFLTEKVEYYYWLTFLANESQTVYQEPVSVEEKQVQAV